MTDVQEADLVDRWVRAWAHTRRLQVGKAEGWPLVHVGTASRHTELVCVDPGPQAFADLLPQVAGDPGAMLTVFARDPSAYTGLDLPRGIRVDRDDETFMTTALTSPGIVDPAPPPGLRAQWDVDGDRATFALQTEDAIAAEGTIGVLGTDAVLDEVSTNPRFRRAGLARQVVHTLTTWAVERGATTGLLAATADGSGLYTALGWQHTLSMWSVMGQTTT